MSYGRRPGAGFDLDGDEVHYPTRPVDKDKAEQELAVNIKKATSTDETAPKQKHVRKCIVYTWDYHSSISFWSGLRVQPILSDEIQTFKALIMVHKVLQEGHPVTIKEAQSQTGWLETCSRMIGHDGGRGTSPLTCSGFHTHDLRRVRSSYPSICTIPASKASIPPTQA